MRLTVDVSSLTKVVCELSEKPQGEAERKRGFWVTSVELIPGWRNLSLIFCVLFCAVGLTGVATGVTAVAMVTVDLAAGCVQAPLAVTRGFTISYLAFLAACSLGVVTMFTVFLCAGTGYLWVLMKFSLWFTVQAHVVVLVLVAQAATAYLAGLDRVVVLVWVVYSLIFSGAVGSLDLICLLPNAHLLYRAGWMLTMAGLAILNLGVYIYTLALGFPCGGGGAAWVLGGSNEYIYYHAYLFFSAAAQLLTVSTYARKIANPMMPSTGVLGPHFFDETAEASTATTIEVLDDWRFTPVPAEVTTHLLVLAPTEISLYTRGGKGLKDESQTSTAVGFDQPTKRAVRIASGLAVISLTLVAQASIALAVALVAGMSYPSPESQCFVVKARSAGVDLDALVRGLAWFRLALLAVIVPGVALLCVAMGLGRLLGKFVIFWARRQASLLVLVAPAWFVARRVAGSSTATVADDVSLLLLPLLTALFDLMSIAVGRGRSGFKLATRLAAFALMLEIAAVYARGVATSFPCPAAPATTRQAFVALVVAQFFNAAYVTEIIKMLGRKLTYPIGAAVPFQVKTGL